MRDEYVYHAPMPLDIASIGRWRFSNYFTATTSTSAQVDSGVRELHARKLIAVPCMIGMVKSVNAIQIDCTHYYQVATNYCTGVLF